jgi:hypothetical protein
MHLDNLKQSLNGAQSNLTEAEAALVDELEQKFFRPLVSTQWENTDVDEYWTYMNEGGFTQNTDL